MENEGEYLALPIRRSDDLVVKVNIDELPDDAIDIIDILKAELSPLDLWFNIAMSYYRQGKEDQFLSIMMEGVDPALDVVTEYKDKKKEKITILNTLAFYYILLATKEIDPKKKEFHWSKVVDFFSRAQKIDLTNKITWLGRGMVQLLRTQYELASKSFDTTLEGEICIPALIGKGLILVNQENYSNAIRYFRKAIQSNPGCPEEVRFALGVCFYKQNKIQASKQCFERVLEMDPNNVEALISLAVLELNSDVSKDKKKSIQTAFQFIKRAYDSNPNHPRVLNFLAEHFFFAEDYDPILKLASQSYSNTDIKEIKAESKYQIGRYHHSQKRYAEAFDNYLEASKLWPQFALAHYGLGQLYIWKKEYPSAITSFEKVLAQYPNNFETLYVLGSLYIKTRKEKKAVDYLQRAVENGPHDLQSKLLLAQLIQNDKYDKALKLYTDSILILKNTNEKVPLEVWNNTGVLYYLLALPITNYFSRIDMFSKSRQCFINLLESEESNPTTFDYENINLEKTYNVSVAYNLARVFEEENEFLKAKLIYDKILIAHPAYFDAQIRLAMISLKKGEAKEAESIIKDVISKSPRNITAMMVLGKIYSVKREYNLAQKEYERILNIDGKDSYSKLSLGNIYYMATYDNKKKEEKKFLKYSNDFYWKVWKEEPNNIYAASGIGMILAEKDKLSAAQLIFTQVREGSTDMPDAWINLANIFMAQSNFPKAIKLYEICSQKFYNSNNLKVLLYLSKAYFESNRFSECESTLNRLIHLNPTDLTLWYNLALTKEASAALELKSNTPTKQSVEKSVAKLEHAVKLFNYLLDLAEKDSKKKYSITKVKNHISSCDKRIQKSKEKIDLAEKLEREKEMKIEAQKIEAEKYRLKKEQELEEKRLEKEKQQDEERKIIEDLEREREEFMVKFREIEKKQAKVPKKSTGGKGSKKRSVDRDIYEDDKDRPNRDDEPEEEQSWEKDRIQKQERANKKLQKESGKPSKGGKKRKSTSSPKKSSSKKTKSPKTSKSSTKKLTKKKKSVLEEPIELHYDEEDDQQQEYDREEMLPPKKKKDKRIEKKKSIDEVEIFDEGDDNVANDDDLMDDDL